MTYKDYRPIPFWSWNDKLEENELIEQIRWMNHTGFGGFFMHARGGLGIEYLGEEWFHCVRACCEEAKELGMSAWSYDENGWPSGFVGGKLLEQASNRDRYLTYFIGDYDENFTITEDDFSEFVFYAIHSRKLQDWFWRAMVEKDEEARTLFNGVTKNFQIGNYWKGNK